MIGGIPAIAVGVTAKARCGIISGIIGAVCAFGGMFLGHYWALSSKVGEFIKADQAIVVSDADGLAEIAQRLASDDIAAGKALKWPEGRNFDNAEELEHYPKEIVDRAKAQWEALDSLAQHNFKEQLKIKRERVNDSVQSQLTRDNILNTLGFLDYVICLVSMGVGFWVASDQNDWFS